MAWAAVRCGGEPACLPDLFVLAVLEQVVAQALGASRGLFKQLGCQAAVGNLDPAERFKEENILLHCASRSTVYKDFGMARVLNAVDRTGKQHSDKNYAEDMRELDEGVWGTIPDDALGGEMPIQLFAYDMATAADWLGAQGMTTHYESPNAHCHCRGCTFDSRHPNAWRPFSFHSQPDPSRPDFKMRSWATLKEVLDKLRHQKLTPKQRDALMAAHSIKKDKLYCVLDPEYIPYVNPPHHAPVDLLHVFPDGILRSEGAWMFHTFGLHGFDIASFNERLRAYPGFPPDVRVPDLHAGLKKGVGPGGKRPNSSSTLRMSGSECMHFALHRCAPAALARPAFAARR